MFANWVRMFSRPIFLSDAIRRFVEHGGNQELWLEVATTSRMGVSSSLWWVKRWSTWWFGAKNVEGGWVGQCYQAFSVQRASMAMEVSTAPSLRVIFLKNNQRIVSQHQQQQHELSKDKMKNPENYRHVGTDCRADLARAMRLCMRNERASMTDF